MKSNIDIFSFAVFFFKARGKKRQIGWFPANYVKLLSPNTNKTTPTEPTPPKLAPACPGTHKHSIRASLLGIFKIVTIVLTSTISLLFINLCFSLVIQSQKIFNVEKPVKSL